MTEAHILVLVFLCLLTPLFCVLPYGFMTPPLSGQGGPVTQMIPLLYPSSMYPKTLFECGYSREGEEEDSEEGEDGLVGESGDEYYSVLCASLGCMWLIKWVCEQRVCAYKILYISPDRNGVAVGSNWPT